MSDLGPICPGCGIPRWGSSHPTGNSRCLECGKTIDPVLTHRHSVTYPRRWGTLTPASTEAVPGVTGGFLVGSAGSTFSAEEVDQIRELLRDPEFAVVRNTSAEPRFEPIGVDAHVPERPRQPVDATRVVNALLAKPELAWGVYGELTRAKIAGPWHLHDEMKAGQIGEMWVRDCPGIRGVFVTRHQDDWRVHGAWNGTFDGSMDAGDVLVEVDGHLEELGYVLV